MAKPPSILQAVIWIARSIAASSHVYAKFDAASLGVVLPDAVSDNPTVVGLLSNLAGSSKDLGPLADELESAAIAGDTVKLIAALTKTGVSLTGHFSGLNSLTTALGSAINPGSIPDPVALASATDLVNGFAKKIFDVILADRLSETSPWILFVLNLIGLADWKLVTTPASNQSGNDFVKKELHLERLQGLISDPIGHLKSTIGWGNPGFDPTEIFNLYRDLLPENAAIDIGNDGTPFLRFGNFEARVIADATPGIRMGFEMFYNKSANIQQQINDSWAINLSPQFNIAGKAAAEIRPPLQVTVQPPSGDLSGSLKLFASRNATAQPFEILGGNDLLTISAKDIQIGLALGIDWNAGSNKAALDILFFLNLVQGKVRIGGGKADSFIGTLLGGANLESTFDLGLEWMMDKGLRVQASGGIEVQLPVHTSIGPIDLNAIYLAMKIQPDGTLATEISAGFTGNLGPLSATVDRMGIILNTKFSNNTSGKFGPLDLSLGFKPPSGVGLSLNAGPVNGGGYLYLDPDKGEYAGALELNILGVVSAKAIGLISTKMPDGSNGFSLLLIITAEFTPPFQLGFGFTIIGIGGLLGLNRTVLLDPLRDSIHSGAINSIVFPQNVVENAPRIISDLRAIFPVMPDRFLIGPMVKMGWGTPTLISLSLGIIIEIPGNIAIVGILRLALPTEEIALIGIQVNFLGVIDFGRKELSFDASLFDSHLLVMTLEGDMAVRLKWGDDATFLITIGGFHPSFTPPPMDLPILKRLSVSILSNPLQSMRAECYQAVTSNTVQFGARVQLRYGFDDFNLTGFLGFDALFTFSPFHFIIDVSAGLSAEVFGLDLLSISLQFSFEGPGRWRARGTGSISIPILPDIDADFDFSWGDDTNTLLPPVQLLPMFMAELTKQDQWVAQLPVSSNLLVALKKTSPDPSMLILHPAGTLVFSQKLMPLGFQIDKLGNQAPSDVNEIGITTAASGPNALHVAHHSESFAIGQYKNLSDAQKLSSPSFQYMDSGVELTMGEQSARAGKVVVRTILYELKIIDKDRSLLRLFVKVSSALQALFFQGSSVKRSPLSQATANQRKPFSDKPVMNKPGFAVANLLDNQLFHSNALFSSEAMAQQHIDRLSVITPGLRNQVHVVANYELNPS
jgi:hypothetical protein